MDPFPCKAGPFPRSKAMRAPETENGGVGNAIYQGHNLCSRDWVYAHTVPHLTSVMARLPPNLEYTALCISLSAYGSWGRPEGYVVALRLS